MKNTENELTERVKNPQTENKLKHRTTEDRNLHSHETSYKANDSGEKTGQNSTPLKRQPVLEQLIQAKRKEIGKESNYNDGKITENRLKQSKPCQSAQPLFDNHFKNTKPNEDTENRQDKRKSGEDWKYSS